jgi:2-amino-4-hydroxy-6-hydroxymethyldihydropteridine diphosphokinase
MNFAYLILGGNIGNRLENLENTRKLINSNAGNVIKKSDIFNTAAWGKTDQPDFFNQALKIETLLTPMQLLNELLKIESQAGRVRDGEKWAARTMDIDILFYNNDIISEMNLKVPHPHLQDRRFVLAPLSQIAGEFIHPVLGKSITALLSECGDHSSVSILEKANNRSGK